MKTRAVAPAGIATGENWKPILNCPAAAEKKPKMTSDKITNLRVARLVRLYSRATHPHCNWTITPTGTFHEVSVIEGLMDDLRMRYPVISG